MIVGLIVIGAIVIALAPAVGAGWLAAHLIESHDLSIVAAMVIGWIIFWLVIRIEIELLKAVRDRMPDQVLSRHLRRR